MDSSAREQQVLFNQKMIEQSAGLLAPLNGQERYLSVSSGHLTQFVKAVLAQCKTGQSLLADTGGRLNAQSLSRDLEFKRLSEQGWSWTIISSKVEAVWPDLPSIAEKALNSSNIAFTGQNEVELLMQLAQIANRNPGVNLQEAAAQLCQTGPLKSYCSDMARWFELYSCKGMFLQFLAPFSKEFGEAINCGQEFSSMCGSPLHAQIPMVRLGMLATNYAAPSSKVSNGLARLLVKSDFEKLKSPKVMAVLNDCENILYQAWEKIEKLLPCPEAVKAFGMLCIRCTLLVLSKEHPSCVSYCFL